MEIKPKNIRWICKAKNCSGKCIAETPSPSHPLICLQAPAIGLPNWKKAKEDEDNQPDEIWLTCEHCEFHCRIKSSPVNMTNRCLIFPEKKIYRWNKEGTDQMKNSYTEKPETPGVEKPSSGIASYILHNVAMAELNKIGEALKLLQNIPTVSINTLTVNINITPVCNANSGMVTLPLNQKEDKSPATAKEPIP